jgi:hypothetical protein
MLNCWLLIIAYECILIKLVLAWSSSLRFWPVESISLRLPSVSISHWFFLINNFLIFLISVILLRRGLLEALRSWLIIFLQSRWLVLNNHDHFLLVIDKNSTFAFSIVLEVWLCNHLVVIPCLDVHISIKELAIALLTWPFIEAVLGPSSEVAEANYFHVLSGYCSAPSRINSCRVRECYSIIAKYCVNLGPDSS